MSGTDGGPVYDSTQLPNDQGSGGASGGSNGAGGAGGGFLKIQIFEVLTVEGKSIELRC